MLSDLEGVPEALELHQACSAVLEVLKHTSLALDEGSLAAADQPLAVSKRFMAPGCCAGPLAAIQKRLLINLALK